MVVLGIQESRWLNPRIYGIILTMRKTLLIIMAVFILSIAATIKHNTCAVTPPAKQPVKKEERDFIGERIEYQVKVGAFSMGKAVYSHLENAELDGSTAKLMTFETDVARFYDLETIYSDPVTFLPIKVTRKIRGWNINEDIVEVYDQKDFILTITKFKGGTKLEEFKFNKISKPLHNAVLLPFYVRRVPDIKPGWSFQANFGNQEFKITLASQEKIQVPAGTFEAFRFESTPEKFLIWITSDERRIPIRIKDTGLFGYMLSMKSYSLEKDAN